MWSFIIPEQYALLWGWKPAAVCPTNSKHMVLMSAETSLCPVHISSLATVRVQSQNFPSGDVVELSFLCGHEAIRRHIQRCL